MALIELTLEGKIDKVKKAISRIQAYAFDETAIGKSIFLAKEAAEKALTERSGK